MPTLKTEFECPTCAKVSGQSHQIVATEGVLSCPANPNHKWKDTQGFFDENPRMVFKVLQAKAPQMNRTPLTIPVPIGLKTELELKYGEKLEATVTAVLTQLVEGTGMIVPFTDVQRLTDRIGARFNNSSELVGLIYSKVCEVDDAKMERDTAVKDLKAYEGLSPGRVVVDLGAQFASAQAKAAEASLPLKVWTEQQVQNMLENNWV